MPIVIYAECRKEAYYPECRYAEFRYVVAWPTVPQAFGQTHKY